MTKGTLIRRLKALSLLGPCMRHGIIPPTVTRDIGVEDRVNSLMRTGMGKHGAVLQAAAECNISADTVYRVLRELRKA